MEIIGCLIRGIRAKKKETGIKMAQRLGISCSYLSQIENGNYGIADKWVSRFCEVYKLKRAERKKFIKAARIQTIKHKLGILANSRKILQSELNELESELKELNA